MKDITFRKANTVLTNTTDFLESLKVSSYCKLLWKSSTKLSGILLDVARYYCPTSCAETHSQETINAQEVYKLPCIRYD